MSEALAQEILDLMELLGRNKGIPSLDGVSSAISRLHFRRWSGSQVVGGVSKQDEKYRKIVSASVQEDTLRTDFIFLFLDKAKRRHTLCGSRPLLTDKRAYITLDGAVVSDANSTITYKIHSHSVQINFRFAIAGEPQDYRFDGYLI